MKILVFAQQLEIGGTQVNAIELAAALRDLHGYEVLLFATPGPMVKLIHEKGLRFVAAPDPRFYPSPARMLALRDVVRDERPDMLHTWDWWQCLDAYYAVHLPMYIPMLVTDMSTVVTRLLPKGLYTTFWSPEVVDKAKNAGRRRVELLVPPVDVRLNAPDAVSPEPFRRQYGIQDGDVTLVTVSRLTRCLKSESLFRTVEAVRTLGRNLPLRFVIVGDGEIRAQLELVADQVNRELRRQAVILTGALLDPRPAYAAADVVVGMGGSALRGMAFAKPVIVVGEEGFSAVLTPETESALYYTGMYGRGKNICENTQLVADMKSLVERPDRLSALGQFSREFVVRHFSLEVVSAGLAALCRRIVAEKPVLRIAVADGFRTAAVYMRERIFLHGFRRALFTPASKP